MDYSQYDRGMQGRTPWHAGKTVGTKRPLTQQIWAIWFFLDREKRLGDPAQHAFGHNLFQ